LSASVSLDSPCMAHDFCPERLSNHCQFLCGTFPDIYTKFDAFPLSDPSRNYIRPDTRLQMKEHKNSSHPSSCMKCCTLTPKIS
jgi:hypothetical protein